MNQEYSDWRYWQTIPQKQQPRYHYYVHHWQQQHHQQMMPDQGVLFHQEQLSASSFDHAGVLVWQGTDQDLTLTRSTWG